MDVFHLRDQVIEDYSNYVQSFLRIRDPQIKAYVEGELERGRLWPDPLVQLNPTFERGETIEELANRGVLVEECARIFRRGKDSYDSGQPLRLHRHQQDALEIASSGKSYVLTTGTGSGKSLAYFVPIVDHVLRHGSGRGIKAIVVYPMNALCNSQLEELRKFLRHGYGEGREPVTFARYTGQEKTEERERIAAGPPDILLTNYVMLELLMTRVDSNDQAVIRAAEGLEFLVLDELHTYRGRQGADVAMLIRRVRERVGAPSMRCIGTSATVAGEGTREERQSEVARIASRLFGTAVEPDCVIGETLRSSVQGIEPSSSSLAGALSQPPVYPPDYEGFVAHPLVAWAERAFGLQPDGQGRLVRKPPVTLAYAARQLAAVTGVDEEICLERVKHTLLNGYQVRHPETGLPVFAFRLHQFVSRGDTVYGSIEPADRRHLALEGQVYVPGSRDRRLFPYAFCRECGEAYFVVDHLEADQALAPRQLRDRAPDENRERRSGFLFIDEDESWEPDEDRLPEDWLELRPNGTVRVKSSNRKWVPEKIYAHPDGRVSEARAEGSLPAWFVPAPFRFCLGCSVSYAGRGDDFGRLGELATEGRSTATTVLSLAIVRGLRGATEIPQEAQKLLSFTDNRQDASLQAGHLNDFVQVSLLRGALYAAVQEAGEQGLTQDVIADRVTAKLGIPFEEYSTNPDAAFLIKRKVEQALRDVTGYRLYRDLRRGWRINAPNLEQTGLLRVAYEALDDLCEAGEVWEGRHPILARATPEQRKAACQVVLDTFRRDLAIKVRYLDPNHQEAIKSNSYQYLLAPWSLEEDEDMEVAPVFRVGTASGRHQQQERTISATSGLGKFLRRSATWPRSLDTALPAAELEPFAEDLLGALVIGGQIEVVSANAGKGAQSKLYQLQAGAIRWQAGDGTPPEADRLRVSRTTSADARTNAFFHDLYAHLAITLSGVEGREHTAQVPAQLREERETAFREGKLAVMYCSPTMELGVDIAGLNAVNLRNVPPTPANYAQRSGRAGRNGQPALVLTYCSSLSPHDQYFFRRQGHMVSGAVMPPRIDLANEDLVRSHLHSVWLAETGLWLGNSLSDVLDLGRLNEGLPLQEGVLDAIRSEHASRRALARCENLAAALATELQEATWYDADWVQQVIGGASAAFDRACDRWRQLYLSARRQVDVQHAIVSDHSADPKARQTAERLRAEAETQLKLLTEGDSDLNSDFYSYRYFAGEGFLPGYNFPRLPLAAYLPGRRIGAAGRREGRDNFVSRARFLAISEFGPRSIIYYEGSRFRVDKAILPLHGHGETDSATRMNTAKFCAVCGYGHLAADSDSERCHNCNQLLDGSARYFSNLFRLQNVATRRVNRITSDEEERMRLGYEVITAFRFAATKDGPAVTRAQYTVDGEPLLAANYAPTATLWRINLGWNRRKEKSVQGFLLDMEKGYWAKQELEATDTPVAPAVEVSQTRVVPFVEDRRNALLLELTEDAGPEALATLQYALKRGIESSFQLEDSELAVELLPSGDSPRTILFYEAAEGGAGVLSRLVREPHALALVARFALENCHFNPETGEDLGRAEGAIEDCEAACYNCLLGYSNQREHPLLDRHRIADLLLEMTDAVASTDVGPQTREGRLDELLAAVGSEAERRFVRFLYDNGHRLPDKVRPDLDGHELRPSFYYRHTESCIYLEGRPDADTLLELGDAGYDVVVLDGEDTWREVVAERSWVFGEGETL